MIVYRQGDVVLIPVSEKLPTDAKAIPADAGRTILAYGEVTGHAHALPMKAAKRYKAGSNGKDYVKVNKPAELRHEEHAPINLPEGLYEMRIAREYTPAGVRQVAD